jgi:hypothetical protein
MSDTPDMRDAAVEGAFGFVLASRDHGHGLSFWNQDYGFGPLFNATVLSEADAAMVEVPIGNNEPEWLAMPAPLHVEQQP